MFLPKLPEDSTLEELRDKIDSMSNIINQLYQDNVRLKRSLKDAVLAINSFSYQSQKMIDSIKANSLGIDQLATNINMTLGYNVTKYYDIRRMECIQFFEENITDLEC